MTSLDRNELAANAGETANYLLCDAYEFLQGFLELHEKPSTPEAILMQAFALLAQRDLQYEESRASTAPAADDGNESERHRQAALDYDWLKWLVSVAMPSPSDAEYQEAQARIQRLAGL